MATRIELNLPPRLLESARATQAANQRQLLNREQQTRDAREVRRQLRQAEAQGRTVRGRTQEQRRNGVPEFPLSKGDWLPRRESPGVAYGYLTAELLPTGSTYTLWSGNGQTSVPLQITPASNSGEPVDVPNTIIFNTIVKRYFSIPRPSQLTFFVDFDSSGTPFTQQVRQFRSTLESPSSPVIAVFPVKPGFLIASTTHSVTRRTTVEEWRYQRIERAARLSGGTGEVAISNAEFADYYANPQLLNYDVTIFQSYSWSGPSIATTETTKTQAPTSSYLISRTGIRPIATPAAVHSWLSAFTSNPDVAQGLGTDLLSSILGTPETIAAAAGTPESCSPKWLQLRRKADDPTTLEARQITALDPITHEPLDPSSGTLVPNVTVPAQLSGNVPPGQALLLTWDWGKPALCRQLLLQLGFSPADLTP